MVGAGRDIIERSLEIYNSGDLDGLLAMYTEDALLIEPEGPHQGREAIDRRLRIEQTAFPDRRMTPVIWVEEGDRVVVEYSWTATHTGSLIRSYGTRVAPTGEELSLAAVSIFHLRHGRIAAHRRYLDLLPTAILTGAVSKSSAPVAKA